MRTASEKFPHCKWGYIDLEQLLALFREVPSLQVRVYLYQYLYIHLFLPFPHCKWGYIAGFYAETLYFTVPSLQVRVYRAVKSIIRLLQGSLTASEGISAEERAQAAEMRFPHCKWGYIDGILHTEFETLVPSLQVRVYRPCAHIRERIRRSLTASECISVHQSKRDLQTLFPHCKWGYISRKYIHNWTNNVPSLQVRVYRVWTWC